MNLYIEIEDGQAKNHPAYELNLIQAFGKIPEQWEPFIRVEEPVLPEGKAFDNPKVTYEKVDGVWTDVYHTRDLTIEEKAEQKQLKIAAYKEAWGKLLQKENFSAWIFNEETIQYEPPIPRPAPDQSKLEQRIRTFWCGADNNWKDTPVRPEGEYKFDFLAWEWVPINV